MNRSELRTEVQRATAYDDSADEAVINQGINFALIDLSETYKFRFLIQAATVSTVANTESVSLASDVVQLISVQGRESDNGWPIQLRPEIWYRNNFPKPDDIDTGKPFFGYYREQTIYFVPIPDDVYTIVYNYYRFHPELSSDSDSTLVSFIDRAVIAYACYHLFLYKENAGLAAIWQREYERRAERAYMNNRRQPAIENPRIDDPGLIQDDRTNDPFTAIDGYGFYNGGSYGGY